MNSTTLRRQRSRTAAAFATTAALMFAAVACGTETASDSGNPAGSPAKVKVAPQLPMSADAAERQATSSQRAAAELQERYLRHLLSATTKRDQVKYRRASEQTTGHWRDSRLP